MLEFLPKIATPSIIALAFMLLVGGGLGTALYEQHASAASVDRLIAQRMSIARVLSVVKDAETGQRGLLLTENEAYLRPYNDALRDLQPRLTELTTSMQGEKAQALIAHLTDVTRHKMAELKRTIDLQHNNQHGAAIKLVQTNEGFELMEDIRHSIYALHDLSAKTLDRERSNAALYEGVLAASIMIIVAAGLITLIIMIRSLTKINIDLKESAAKRDALADQLRQSTKMEVIGQLTSGIAHDLNNILMGVSGSLQLTKRSVDLSTFDKVPQFIDMAQRSVQRAAELTHRLLAFSRKQSLEPKLIDVGDHIATLLDMLRRTLGPSIDIKLLASDHYQCYVDPSQLESSILNLCVNARDAMPDGGSITIAIDAVSGAEPLPSGDYIAISVNDTGAGISPEIIEKVFDPFFTTKPIGKGTGLGLSMVHGFANQSNGEIRCQSRLGVGTTMQIILPEKK